MIEFSKWTLLAGVIITGLVFAGCTLTRAGYQSPKYTVTERVGPVEIREYAEIVLAQTPAQLSQEGRDGSFTRLFRFISKGNARAQAIPMTTPVLYRGAGGSGAMAFVMPSGVSNAEVPAPLDGAVEITRREGGLYAVFRMRNGRGVQMRERAVEALRRELAGSGWQFTGEPEFAFYDPPWIPWFLEKNELVWRVSRR
jgi:SOUL heme-binding protein